MAPGLPPFVTVLKSRDVEDPVNLWVHRPAAYGLVALLYRTPVTPNQITLLAMLVGITAGVCWFIGTPALIVTGGILLWTSSILDGADGILARAKQMQSDVGRALDGTADALVAAVTVAAAFYQLWSASPELGRLTMMIVALVTAVVQIYLYDYYKEVYLHATRPGRASRRETAQVVADRLARCRAEGAGLPVRFALSSHVTILRNQHRSVSLTNPASFRLEALPVTEESARIYRRHALGPMQLWALISLCPHTYLLSLSAILLRLDLYLWFRALVANALFVIVLLWQRRATTRALAAMERAGATLPDDRSHDAPPTRSPAHTRPRTETAPGETGRP